jgi:hypothetical protein
LKGNKPQNGMQKFYGKNNEQKAVHQASANQISSLKAPCNSSCAEIIIQCVNVKYTPSIFYEIMKWRLNPEKKFIYTSNISIDMIRSNDLSS